MEPVNAAIIYYSSTGTVHAMARAAAEGAEKAGARVRLRKVAELAPAGAINAKPAWRKHLQDTADIATASLEDLSWADVVLFGTPTRFGNPASQLRAFMETTGGLWQEGRLAGKVYSAITASSTAHGGQESTLLALGNTFYHWGGIIVPPGYTHPIQFKSGNPYGTSHVAGNGPPDELILEAARYQARHAVETAAALKAGKAPLIRVGEQREDEAATEERHALSFFLNRVRDAAVRTSEGLTKEQQRTPGVPSGTNLLGLIRHLTAMEVEWFQRIFLGEPRDIDSSMRVPTSASRDEVVAAYREACAQSDRIVRECRDLSTLSMEAGRLPASTSGQAAPGGDVRVSLRRIVVHMIEETARHAGHADILREQIDGATDL